MGNPHVPAPVRKKNKNGKIKSAIWWFRKKVPDRYYAVVGRREVWRSLETTDKRDAIILCAKYSAEMEKDWQLRLRAAQKATAMPLAPQTTLTMRELSGLQRLAHEQTRDVYRHRDPPAPYRWGMGMQVRSEEQADDEREYDEADLAAFLAINGYGKATEADRARFLPMFLEARRVAAGDLHRMTYGKYTKSDVFKDNAEAPTNKIGLPAAFEFYLETSGVKGGARGPTATRWRPKIRAFCDFMKHDDLALYTNEDGYRWMDHLIAQGHARKTVRDVWIACLKATAGYMVERGTLKTGNPFAKIRVRGVKSTGQANKKAFSPEQAKTILTATLAEPSRLTTTETRACRRWVPWICAYTGARVGEIVSLLTSDIRQDPETGLWCFYLRPEVTKGDYERVVPLHSHLLEQKLLDFVEDRRKRGLPLFYVPTSDDPQDIVRICQKKADRLADWVTDSLHVTGVMPNHGWRHLFKSIARHVHMHPEVEHFIVGHGGSDDREVIDKVSVKYGDAWVATLKNAIEMYPRFEIDALNRPPEPRKKTRRTRAQIDAEKAAKPVKRRVGLSTEGAAR